MIWLTVLTWVRKVPFWVWLALAIAGAVMFYGHLRYNAGQAACRAEAAEAIANQKAKQDKVTIKVVTKYVDRVQVIREKAKTIIQKVPVYVTAENDAACVIPESFISLWNYANEGAIPDTAIRVDEGTGKAPEAETGR